MPIETNAGPRADTTGRYDLYGPIHKALRRGHTQILMRLGSADFSGGAALLLADVRRHLAVGELHLVDEEHYIHTALEQRMPGASAAIEDDHAEHRRSFAVLEALIASIEAAPDAATASRQGRALYLAFSRFVGEDLEHMAFEEEVVWGQLCAVFTDAELIGIERAIVASIAPDMVMHMMQLMVPATNPAERAALLGGMKAGAPPQVYAALYNHAARPTLSPAELAELEALDLAA